MDDELFRQETIHPLISMSKPLVRTKVDLSDRDNCSLLHPANGLTPRVVTEDGILTLCKELHLLKAQPPIEATEDGIVTLNKEPHS